LASYSSEDTIKEFAPTQKQPSDQEGKINAELRKLRAQYPDARNDLEAVAIGGQEAHADARQHLARVDAIVSKLDRAADQLQSVNTDQDSELNVLDRENNDLEQKIKDLEQKLSKVSQPRTKAADMPAQARQDKQAKQDNTSQDAAPARSKQEPAAPARSKPEPADKGVGLGHVAAQLKDLPSTVHVGKKSEPDQLPPNVSKINFFKNPVKQFGQN
jgi:DNA repair exonuclease SbcCD ATPase subunit